MRKEVEGVSCSRNKWAFDIKLMLPFFVGGNQHQVVAVSEWGRESQYQTGQCAPKYGLTDLRIIKRRLGLSLHIIRASCVMMIYHQEASAKQCKQDTLHQAITHKKVHDTLQKLLETGEDAEMYEFPPLFHLLRL